MQDGEYRGSRIHRRCLYPSGRPICSAQLQDPQEHPQEGGGVGVQARLKVRSGKVRASTLHQRSRIEQHSCTTPTTRHDQGISFVPLLGRTVGQQALVGPPPDQDRFDGREPESGSSRLDPIKDTVVLGYGQDFASCIRCIDAFISSKLSLHYVAVVWTKDFSFLTLCEQLVGFPALETIVFISVVG